MFKNIKNPIFVFVLIFIPIVIAIFCLGIGRYSIPFSKTFSDLISIIFNGKDSIDAQHYKVIINLRLPRIILAMLCGSGLAVAGASLQSLFSNPLVSPDTLGVASGASFGAALALLFKANLIAVQLSAMMMGIIAVWLTYRIAKTKGSLSIVMLILSGMTISALFSALVSLVKYSADTQNDLPAITFWLMGSLGKANFKLLSYGAFPIILGCIVLFLIRWKLNILSLSEEEAKTLGVNVKTLRIIVILASTMITASIVSMCGLIGWVGLLIPHICRIIFGSNNKYVIPATLSIGAIFFLIIDTLSRGLLETEIPVSILTSIIGAPCFIMLLRKTGGIK